MIAYRYPVKLCTGLFPPPKDRSKANTRNSVRNLWISESLFADDTTACGSRQEMTEGKETLKEVMGWFEERCHPDKEEHLEFGRKESNNIRMIGTYIGRKEDVEKRLSRMSKACFLIRKRLKGTRLSKRGQGKIVEACAEATALFDSQIHPWHKSEMMKLQTHRQDTERNAKKEYKHVWS